MPKRCPAGKIKSGNRCVRPRSLLQDKEFRKWLEDEKNIESGVLLTLGTQSTIRSYRNEYLRTHGR